MCVEQKEKKKEDKKKKKDKKKDKKVAPMISRAMLEACVRQMTSSASAFPLSPAH